MAFRQQQRPQLSRPLSYHEPALPAEVGTAGSPQRKRFLEESEEWVLFSPVAPSTTARTHTTSTERTPRTAGLSRLSDFGSLDTAARSQEDDDDVTCQGTEEGEELDSLDDGLHAFHEPSEYAGPSSRIQQSAETVLPTHDGLGTFQPNVDVQEHMWQFERPRRRPARRRSSVQRRFDLLDETEEVNQEADRRQRIEKWRLEQSKALLEEIERETRRRRRMSMVSTARSRADSIHTYTPNTVSQAARSVSDRQSESSDEGSEDLSFWQRLTRRVIRDLMGIDEDTLSVIFGEALPEEEESSANVLLDTKPSIDATLQSLDIPGAPDEDWQHRLLERVARELGILVHQLSEHPGAFSTYRSLQETPTYAGLTTSNSLPPLTTDLLSSRPATVATSATSPTSPYAHFAPTVPVPAQPQPSAFSEASLWGIEEEPEPADPLASSHPSAPINYAEEAAREQEYWERELDVKMVFNFLVQRFSSRRPSTSSTSNISTASRRTHTMPPSERAALIRQNHPLVKSSRSRDSLPTSSAQVRRKERGVKTYYVHHHPHSRQAGSLRGSGVNAGAGMRSSDSCKSLSTKVSLRSGGSGRSAGGRNFWDLSGSVGSGSVVKAEA